MEKSIFFYQEAHGPKVKIDLKTALNKAFLNGANRQTVKEYLYKYNEFFFQDGSRIIRVVNYV